MANSYTQIHIHFVFAVKYREAVISNLWKDRLQMYMTAIVQNYGHKLLIINNVPDHIHLLVGMRPKQSISDLMEKVKSDSSAWINDNHLTKGHFNWQPGYGAFSLSKSHVERCIQYIMNQEEHHQKIGFRDEYLDLLRKNEIDFDERYLFEDLM